MTRERFCEDCGGRFQAENDAIYDERPFVVIHTDGTEREYKNLCFPCIRSMIMGE